MKTVRWISCAAIALIGMVGIPQGLAADGGARATPPACPEEVEALEAGAHFGVDLLEPGASPPNLRPREALALPYALPCPTRVANWVLSPPRPPPLDRFCHYTGPESATARFPSTLQDCRFQAVELADEPIVEPQAPFRRSLLAEVVGLFSAHLWMAHAEILPPGALSPPVGSSGPPVRLAILDTLPPQAPSPRSGHGPTMVRLADRAVAVLTGDRVRIEPWLALPRIGFTVDRVNGGRSGSLWDLAVAIVDAISAGGGSAVVLNLSLGWDGVKTPSSVDPDLTVELDPRRRPGTASVGAAAVFAALSRARCEGALILAASGNSRLDLTAETGPLFPAAWGGYPSPSAAACRLLSVETNAPAQAGWLLHPIGGLGRDFSPLSNERQTSTPPLVAPAEGGTGEAEGEILTGTSVATLLTSATAAVVWALRPSDASEAVMERIETSAIPVGRVSSFPGRPPLPVRRVSQLEAVRAAAVSAGLPPPPVPPGYGAAYRAAAMQLLFTQLHEVRSLFAPVVSSAAPRPASSEPLFRWASMAERTFTRPQPDNPSCPACVVEETPAYWDVFVYLGRELPTNPVLDLTLLLRDVHNELRAVPLAELLHWEEPLRVVIPRTTMDPSVEAWIGYRVPGAGEMLRAGDPITLIVHP